MPEHEQEQILCKCHYESYGGHHAGDRTAHKVLQSGFYWSTPYKDTRKFVLSYDECQRIGNIGKHQEMPMSYSLAVEPFDVWGFDYMGPFPSSNLYTHILVALIMLLSGYKLFQLVVLIITLPLKCLKKLFSQGLESLDI